ncbi:MAG: acyltransferase family protein, partial [Lachnospiraceae bacterium]|nr:acyltransferase family protein [Lachnospiraceae bacterium]
MQKKIIHIKPQSKSKLASLDILKGIAIIMIIIVHNRHFVMKNMDGLRQLINFGQMGCQIFFLVSGTALCYSWTSHLKKSKEKNIFVQYITFIKNRYLRLAPGFLLILFINLLLNIILMDICNYSPGYVMSRSVKGILLNVFFLHGLSKEFINEVFPGGWYIGTAFILYIIFPFLFSICKIVYERFKA